MVEDFLSTDIKEIILRYPAVGGILSDFDIACVSCNVGSCQLRDIIEIHNLAPEQEQAVLGRIARVVFPDREIGIPPVRRRQRSKSPSLSPPLKKLVQEHVLIKRLLHFVPPLIEELKTDPSEGRTLIEEGVDFIRTYADRFHHAKEEEILFKYFDPNARIFQVMRLDHEQARSHARQIGEALKNEGYQAVCRHLDEYKTLLDGHIQKEDEVLFPWMNRNLTISQVGELFSRFTAADGQFGEEPKRSERYILRLEEIFESRQLLRASHSPVRAGSAR